jgi:hypothetical protein
MFKCSLPAETETSTVIRLVTACHMHKQELEQYFTRHEIQENLNLYLNELVKVLPPPAVMNPVK